MTVDTKVLVAGHETAREQLSVFPYQMLVQGGSGDPAIFGFAGGSPSSELANLSAAEFASNPIVKSTTPELNTRFAGKIIRGKIETTPFRMSTVNLVVSFKDDKSKGFRLAIGNYTLDNLDQDMKEIKKMLLPGMEIGIKEPYCKIAADNRPVVKVEDPFHLVVYWSPFAPSYSKDFGMAVNLLAARGVEVVTEGPLPEPSMTHVQLKDKGNDLFKEKSYLHAAYFYRAAANRDPSNVIYWSNLSEALIQMRDHVGALATAEKAVAIDPKHAKSIKRKGHALSNMGFYAEAQAAYDLALKCMETSDPTYKDTVKLRDDTKLFSTMQDKGLGAWRNLTSAATDYTGSIDKIPELSSALEVKRSELESERGYGLFAARDIASGEIVAVSVAAASVELPPTVRGNRVNPNGSTDKVSNVLLESEVLRLLRTSPAASLIIGRLMGGKRLKQDPMVCEHVTWAGVYKTLVEGLDSAPAPAVASDDLTPVLTGPSPRTYQLTVDCVRDKVRVNGAGFKENSLEIYGLGSIFNHAASEEVNNCAIESSGVKKGLLVVKANTAIKKGEELLINYFDFKIRGPSDITTDR